MKVRWIYNFLVFGLSGCGNTNNVFQGLENETTEITACRYLEHDEPKKAITLILDKLGQNFSNIYKGITSQSIMLDVEAALKDEIAFLVITKPKTSNLVSILASAQAQKYGIDPLKVAIALATDSSSTEEEASALADATSSSEVDSMLKLFPVLPEATLENIKGLEISTTLLNALGNSGSEADQFKKALFLTSGVALIVKSLDLDEDGKISTTEAINLSDEAAESLVSQITAAALSVLVSGSSDDSRSASSGRAITAMQEKIADQEGASESEKLRNYLASATAK